MPREQAPWELDCTNKGLFVATGPSGTARGYLDLWLVLGGSREKRPEMRFAMAALLLQGLLRSLIRIMATCAPILKQEMPGYLSEMLKQLVPRRLELEHQGVLHSVMPDTFYCKRASCLEYRVDFNGCSKLAKISAWGCDFRGARAI